MLINDFKAIRFPLILVALFLALSTMQAQQRRQRPNRAPIQNKYLKGNVYKLTNKISFGAVPAASVEQWSVRISASVTAAKIRKASANEPNSAYETPAAEGKKWLIVDITVMPPKADAPLMLDTIVAKADGSSCPLWGLGGKHVLSGGFTPLDPSIHMMAFTAGSPWVVDPIGTPPRLALKTGSALALRLAFEVPAAAKRFALAIGNQPAQPLSPEATR